MQEIDSSTHCVTKKQIPFQTNASIFETKSGYIEIEV